MIEDIILQHSGPRAIHTLRQALPADFCARAADVILSHPGKVLITTGFWVGGNCETDGPPGAIALADVLSELGSEVLFVSDCYCCDILRACRNYRVVDFPIVGHKASREFAESLLRQEQVSLLISIERCGMSADRRYYNMRKDDISDYTAKIDYLFEGNPPSIGIGDGGNEIGMGNLLEAIQEQQLPIAPCVTRVDFPVIATVSNWAAYGIIAYLSLKTQQNYMRFLRIGEILKQLVALGVVDGVVKQPQLSVDGFPLSTIKAQIKKLSESVSVVRKNKMSRL